MTSRCWLVHPPGSGNVVAIKNTMESQAYRNFNRAYKPGEIARIKAPVVSDEPGKDLYDVQAYRIIRRVSLREVSRIKIKTPGKMICTSGFWYEVGGD